MKAKILFVVLILLLQCNFMFSQCINVELSITWEEGFDIFNKKSKVSIPKLNITYRNDCDKSYYFLKVSPTKDETPILGCSISLHPMETISKRKKKVKQGESPYLNLYPIKGIFTNLNFNVIIGIEPSIDIGWFISSDTEDYYDSNAYSISCILKSFYEYLNPEYNTNYKNRYADFVSTGLTPDSIMYSSIKEQFVFLKAGETFTVSYNLVGFQLVEGCFTFGVDKNKIENFITNFPKLDFAITTYGALTLKLPAMVGEYQLFSGAINTNTVTVCFGERKK
jgi:hypothetical protein